MFDKTVIL